MSPDQVRQTYETIQVVARLAALVEVHEAQAVVEAIALTDSAMPILDPAGWMQIRHTAPGHNRLARAFLAFRQELEQLRKGTTNDSDA